VTTNHKLHALTQLTNRGTKGSITPQCRGYNG
jgi:hypothetical protein